MTSPVRGFTVREYIKSFNKDHGTQYKTFKELSNDNNYNYHEFNAFQHAYASASSEYILDSTGSNVLGYGKETWQVLVDEPSWDMADTNKDLQNNDLGRSMGNYARRNGISPEDLRDRIYFRTKHNSVYYDPTGLWNNAPDNARNYIVTPGRGGDWAIFGYRPDTWAFSVARYFRDKFKNTIHKSLDVKGKIVPKEQRGGGGGGGGGGSDPNAPTPSMAEDAYYEEIMEWAESQRDPDECKAA